MKVFNKWTAWAVLLFVVLMTAAFVAEADESPHAAQLGLGGGYESSKGLITQRFGYLYDKKWYVRFERFGGNNWNDANGFFFGRRVQLRQEHTVQPFLELGVAYFDELLVKDKRKLQVSDPLTYTLGVGFSVRLSEKTDIEIGLADHNSTAGRSKKNSGIDRGYLQYTWRF